MTGPTTPPPLEAGGAPGDGAGCDDEHEGTGPLVDAPAVALREALRTAGYTGAARAPGAWAVRSSDGVACTVHVLRRAALPTGTDAHIARLRGVDHPHVARVVAVVEAGGEVGVVLRGAPGTAFDDVLARRGALRPGEVVALVAAVARGLEALHGAGIVHGGPAAGDVTIDDDGRAHLRPRVLMPSTATTARDDVRALARLARAALADGAGEPGDDPAALPDAVQAGEALELAALLDGVASGGGCDAAALATRVEQVSAAAEPVVVPDLAALAGAAFGREAGQPARGAPVTGAVRPVRGVVRRPVAQVPRGRTIGPATADPLEDTLVRARGLVVPDGLRALRGRDDDDGSPRAGRSRARSRARHRRRRRSVLVLAACASAAVVLVGVLLALRPLLAADGTTTAHEPTAADAAAESARPGPSSTVPGAAASPAGQGTDVTRDRDRPAEAARELTARRGAMLAGTTPPDAVTVPGSTARAADDALVAALTQRGTIESTPRVTVTGARVVESGDGVARVDVTYAVGPYALRAADGSDVDVPATQQRTDRLLLAWTDAGWRVRGVG